MINIIDMIGNSDYEGNPVGHPIKVVKLFKELFKAHSLNIILPSNYKEYLPADNYFAFKKRLMRSDIKNKVYNALFKLYYYRKFTKIYKGNLFFINTDIYLLFAMSMIKKSTGTKTFAIVYRDYLLDPSFIKRKIVERAYKNLDYIIMNEIGASSHPLQNNIIFPDYFYVKEYYEMEKTAFKYDFLIMGIISSSKNIENVLSAVFSKKGEFTLKISGRFDDSDRFIRLSEKYKDAAFISIENEYIDENKYKKLLSESKFLVLPYDGKDYADRGSGVFYDALYFKTPVIATDINLFKSLRKREMGILYKSSFEEAIEEIATVDYTKFLSNIQHFCEENSVERYRNELEEALI